MTFNEFTNEEFSFSNSKTILGRIINKKHLKQFNGQEFIKEIVKYWKALR
jgi:hypothetical protein